MKNYLFIAAMFVSGIGIGIVTQHAMCVEQPDPKGPYPLPFPAPSPGPVCPPSCD